MSKHIPKLATVNGLALYEQPLVLSQLNMLERHLICPALPFMKMIPLIKGAQKGISGQVVCVKADITNTVQCLPRLPTDQSLIRVKLKRKLEYKGHHMCQDVNPTKVRKALYWLKVNNPEYQDIDINFDDFDTMLDDQLLRNLPQQDQESDDHTDERMSQVAPTEISTMNDDIDDKHDDSSIECMEYYNNDDYLDYDSDVSYHVDVNPSSITGCNADCTDTIKHDAEYPIAESSDLNIEDNLNDNMQDRNDEQFGNDQQDQSDQNNENDVSDEVDDITNTSAPLYSFLHPVDFTQYLADKHNESILSLAPGEGNRPEKVLKMEAKCFPAEFPDGRNTYTEERKQKLSPSRYFNARLFSADNRWARNPEYTFFALYATEVDQINSNVSIAIRVGCTKTADGKKLTASMFRDHEEVKKLIKRDQGYRFLTQIRGTPAYWEKSKRDLFAMIRQLGIPTWFVTCSAADRRWIEIDNGILISQGKPPMTEDQHKNMTWEDHCSIIMSNPAAAAKMFQQRVRTYINNVIMSKANPIGNVEDYYYRTEFQQRGWPHIHMVIWVKDAPKFKKDDPDNDHTVTEFVDKYISCELPPESDEELHEIVTTVQMHTKNHTKSCRKTEKPIDGIEGNENDPSYIAALAERGEEEKKAKETLKKVWELVEATDAEFNQILQNAGVTQSEFEEYLALVTKKNTMYLKRRVQDQWVNNYNPHLIRCWNGNMDIQYVLDPYAAAMYMLSYITKSEREMGDLLKRAQKEAAEGNDDAVSELRKLGTVYLQHREISVMGAIYLVCSMPLKKSTRNIIFLQTDMNGQKLSLPLNQLQENAGKSEQVWMTSQIEKYIGRPKTAKYNNMCMATFFSSHYQVSSKSDNINANEETDDETDSDESSDEEETHSEAMNQDKADKCQNDQVPCDKQATQKHTNSRHSHQPIIKLHTCSVKMRERTQGKPAVIRYPRVSMKKDSERYHMNMLRLYLPHRNENIKPTSYVTYQDYYMKGYTQVNGKKERVKDVVKHNMADFEPEDEDIDAAWDALQDAIDLQDAWAVINPQGEQQRLDDEVDRNIVQDSDDDFVEIQIPEFQSQNTSNKHDQPRCAIETCKPEITEEQAESMMRQLNDKQRQLFNYVSKWCDEKTRDRNVPPFHIFLTGGAGTGKSHVIKCVSYYAQKAFASITESVDESTVLLLAHLGTAAFNIFGQTICTGLKILPKSQKDYKPLAEQTLNTLRAKYHHLQLVIIDEISMVSTTQLSYIHGRLQQIKGTSDSSYFGNVSILAVGDFYQLPPISPPRPLCFPHEEILKDIWNPLFKIVQLTEIMRQRDDAVFAQMLNRFRVRKRNEPLHDEDEQLLQSRRVKDNVLTAPSNALHLFYANKDVDNHNAEKLASLSTEKYTIKAADVDQSDGRIIKVHETPHETTRIDDTSLTSYLKLAVGTKVMLIANVDVSDGLCNGVSGIVKGIEFGNSENMPTVVYVKFDSDRIGLKSRTSQFIPPHYAGCVPIKPRKETFRIREKHTPRPESKFH
ncbi:uncharacterized protein [Amphiura filiformis]|uniref:uncharacterized protein n=1 Tax=Amphiura filiformis TaxID=82378 RepID=UPI003B21FB43